MGRVKMNFFDVLDKYEYWKENCEKSVLGEFSSVVSIFCNKGTQSDLGAPRSGVRGALPPALGLPSSGVTAATAERVFRHSRCWISVSHFFWWNIMAIT